MTTKPAPLIELTEASRLLRVHPQTLRAWVASGRIPCIRRPGGGGRRRFDPAEIARVQREMGISHGDE